MKYHIWTIGCQMNVADSQRVAASLEQLGLFPTPDAHQADVVVLNTCVVRQSAEDRAHGKLGGLRPLKDQRPEMVVNLMGCLVGVKHNDRLRERYPFVDVFSAPADPEPLITFLAARDPSLAERLETVRRHALMDGEIPLPAGSQGQVAAYVSAVHGCSHACAFCVIPFRRGIERSRSLEAVRGEVAALAAAGVREVTLLGQIVDRYGMDLPDRPSLAALLRSIHNIDGLERIRFLTSHPSWMSDELLQTVADLPKVCEHIEVPVQAGDDDGLARMKRGYTVDQYRRLIDRIRDLIPGASIATDIIVGFPGETETQFRRTFDLLEVLQLDVAHLARYSPRPDTVAARRMIDDIPESEKMDRFRQLEDLQEGIANRINQGYVGNTVEVLVEEEQRPGHWKGRTRTNKLTFFDAPGQLRGSLARLRITWAGPWTLRGELV
jgi:tRNA-2-methylthio-N6-dimethylallyladenosine synthase